MNHSNSFRIAESILSIRIREASLHTYLQKFHRYAEEVKVDFNVPAPDYVFKRDYNLLPITEFETYINQNKHLPEVPSAKEMEVNGLNLKEMNLLLLKKVEELSLHLIEQSKNDQEQKAQIKLLQIEVEQLKNIK